MGRSQAGGDGGKIVSMRSQYVGVDPAALQSFADDVRRATIEEIAAFVETHYCIMDPNRPGKYITESRAKHPCEPLAKAIRDLKVLPAMVQP